MPFWKYSLPFNFWSNTVDLVVRIWNLSWRNQSSSEHTFWRGNFLPLKSRLLTVLCIWTSQVVNTDSQGNCPSETLDKLYDYWGTQWKIRLSSWKWQQNENGLRKFALLGVRNPLPSGRLQFRRGDLSLANMETNNFYNFNYSYKCFQKLFTRSKEGLKLHWWLLRKV
jgi:hypothetical protein